MSKKYYIHILTNHTNSILYIGVTGSLVKSVWEHKNSFVSDFSSRYKVNNLIYFEIFETSYKAITREKQIKGRSRKKKVGLISNLERFI